MAQTITGRIVDVERLSNSVNGNPRFRVHIEGHGWAVTSSDAACSYDIENFRHSGDMAEFGLTRARRITSVRRINPINV